MKTLRISLIAAACAAALVTANAQAPERPMISGIAHVAFRVSAIDEARKFYREVLGLTETAAPARAGQARVRFRVNDRQEVHIEPGLLPDTDERLSHLAFATTSVSALSAYLKAHGVTIEATPPVLCEAGAIWVKDPDGHPIEFVEQPPTPAARTGVAAGTAPPAISARVLHAGLTIRDPEAADRFYKDALGFSEIWRGGSTDTITSWINMKLPNGTDYLEYMLVSGPVSRQRLGSAHHVAMLVPDIQAAYETVLERTPADARSKLASPQVGRNRRYQLNLYDPDGSRVELMEPFTIR